MKTFKTEAYYNDNDFICLRRYAATPIKKRGENDSPESKSFLINSMRCDENKSKQKKTKDKRVRRGWENKAIKINQIVRSYKAMRHIDRNVDVT